MVMSEGNDMSWLSMNHVELQAIRKILMLEVTEAADVIGMVYQVALG